MSRESFGCVHSSEFLGGRKKVCCLPKDVGIVEGYVDGFRNCIHPLVCSFLKDGESECDLRPRSDPDDVDIVHQGLEIDVSKFSGSGSGRDVGPVVWNDPLVASATVLETKRHSESLDKR